MSDPPPATCGHAARQFTKTTTLHGFKYLSSNYCSDRWGWVMCCCASAGCAGMLCAVLWARFLQVPALMTVRELAVDHKSWSTPLVGICPSAHTVAYLFEENLIINKGEAERLPNILENVLHRKVATWSQLRTLDDLLKKNNVTLGDALMRVLPPCHTLVRNCRWQSITLPCDQIFVRKLTQWGACCRFKISELNMIPPLYVRLSMTKRLSVAVECSLDQSLENGCEFYTYYKGEEWVEPTFLTPGFTYVAQMSFTSVVESTADRLVDESCTSDKDYSRTKCLLKCREESCGCSDPLSVQVSTDEGPLTPCPVMKLNCLRFHRLNTTRGGDALNCGCLPPCKKLSTELLLESSQMNSIHHSFDDIYNGLNESSGVVLHIVVSVSTSKLFVVNPTETWLTLLSSLGGVFNMFLGVGMFSALEILFFLFVRCPTAIRIC